MKKLLILLLLCAFILGLAACGGGSGTPDTGAAGAPETEEAVLPEEDSLGVPGVKYEVPEGYVSVEKMADRKADGALFEFNARYLYDENTMISVALAENQNLDEVADKNAMESAEHNGSTYYIQSEGGIIYGVTQVDSDVYGVQYQYGTDITDEAARATFDAVLGSMEYGDYEYTTENDETSTEFDFTLPTLTLESLSSVNRLSAADGKMERKSVTWRFGDDPDDLAYRFLIRVIYGGKVEDETSSSGTYETAEIGGKTYTVRLDSEGDKYEYYLQDGENVYVFKNLGSGGWFSTRSEESDLAFDALINSVVYK